MLIRWTIALSSLSLSLGAFGCKAKADVSASAAEPVVVTQVHMVRPAADRVPVAASTGPAPGELPGVDSVQEQADYCRKVEQQARETNASLPKRLDRDTSATRVAAYGCDVVLEYAMLDLSVKDVAVNGMRAMRAEVLAKLCSDGGARGVMEHGGSFTNVYRDDQDALIDQFTITTEDCPERPANDDAPAHVEL